ELKNDLHDANVEVADYLEKLHPDFKKEIQAELDQKKRELEAHVKNEPSKVDNPDKNQDENQSTNGDMQQIQALDVSITSIGGELRKSVDRQVAIGRKIQNLASCKEDALRIKRSVSELLSAEKAVEIFGEQADDVVTVTVNDTL